MLLRTVAGFVCSTNCSSCVPGTYVSYGLDVNVTSCDHVLQVYRIMLSPWILSVTNTVLLLIGQ